MPKATHSVSIFLEAANAVANGVHMLPRSKDDKEYFPQDWFAARVAAVGLPQAAQGRNSYPDFWVGDAAHSPREGFEVKSLAFANGRPARSDFDSNSTIPSGQKHGHDVFLVFFLYTGSGANPRPVHSLTIAHADLINADHAVAAAHLNEGVQGFGTFGEGFIRNRKMYVFPTPYTIDPSGLSRCRLIVPAAWAVNDGRLQKVGTLNRVVAGTELSSYHIHLDGVTPAASITHPRADAGKVHSFDVFERV